MLHHDPKLQEWYYRMMDDPIQWEKFRYIESINVYSSLIGEHSKLYEQTSVTQRYARARIRSVIKQSQRELAKTQAEYDEFKKFKQRTAISK